MPCNTYNKIILVLGTPLSEVEVEVVVEVVVVLVAMVVLLAIAFVVTVATLGELVVTAVSFPLISK